MPAPDLELYRAAVEQAPDAVIFADREGTIRLWNARDVTQRYLAERAPVGT